MSVCGAVHAPRRPGPGPGADSDVTAWYRALHAPGGAHPQGVPGAVAPARRQGHVPLPRGPAYPGTRRVRSCLYLGVIKTCICAIAACTRARWPGRQMCARVLVYACVCVRGLCLCMRCCACEGEGSTTLLAGSSPGAFLDQMALPLLV